MSPTEILATFTDGEPDEPIEEEVEVAAGEIEEELPAEEEPEEEIAVEEEGKPAEEALQEPDWQAIAEEQGHRPKEDFTGDPNDWVDAKEYVQRWKILGPAREETRKLREDYRKLQSTVSAEVRKFEKDRADRDAEENRVQLSAWESRYTEAVEAGDGAAALIANKEMHRLEGVVNSGQTTEQPQREVIPDDIQSVADDFMARNTWFKTDRKLTNAASAYIGAEVDEVRANGGVLDEKKFKEITAEVEDLYSPTKRADPPPPPRRLKAALVAESQRSSPAAQQRTKTFNDLASDDKAGFNAQVKMGIWKNNAKDRAQFARDILSEEGKVKGKDNTFIMRIGD